ncbi:MAG: L-serine ammonia-lyase, iron-sulfur-dependent, subunit alpha [Candidatus Gracilibacteria bacterium]|nr:L-serine ammonia-lyase, iron-sulfur-dependent, subunit alpha [Candidatus Gracilibacteria bacterium]
MADSFLFFSSERLLTLIERNDDASRISDIVIKAETELTGHSEDEIIANSIDRLRLMRQAVNKGLEVKESKSRMVKDEAKKMMDRVNDPKMLMSPLEVKASAYALAVMANNAVMGTIVAAPTAGSSGIIPGALLSLQEEMELDDETTARGLLCSAGVGMVIAHIATFSAAKAGCQAEIGASSAMCAAAISELRGMSPDECVNAAAIALKNMLGLACDPIAGLVEVPCVKRNAIGVSHAMTASDMVYTGVKSIVPFDEVVMAMNNIAKNMNSAIRETSQGGLAISKTGRKISNELLQIGK